MSSIGRLLLVYIVGLLLLCPHLCRYVRRPRLFIPSIRYICWSHGTAGLAVLRVVTELYMIVCDLFQFSWLISWLTTARHPASFQLTLMSVSYHYWHERAIIRLVPRCHTATYKPTLLRGSFRQSILKGACMHWQLSPRLPSTDGFCTASKHSNYYSHLFANRVWPTHALLKEAAYTQQCMALPYLECCAQPAL